MVVGLWREGRGCGKEGEGGLGEKVFDVPVVYFSGRICVETVGKPVLKVE